MFKRFFLLLLAFTVSLSAFSVLLPVTANAASPYDNYIHNAVPPYQIKSSNNSLTSQFDDWEQLLDYVGTNYETRLAQGNSFCGNTITETQFSTILDLLNGGGKFLVGQTNTNNITFYVDTNPTDTITHTWYNDGMGGVYDNYNSSTSSFISFFITIANNGNRPICGSYTGTPDIGSMSAGDIIASSLPFTIPSPDYAGEIPASPGVKDKLHPRVSYTIDDDNLLNALNAGIFEDVCIPVGNPTSGCAPPQIKWTLLDEEMGELNTQTLSMAQPYTYQFPTIGTFYLQAKYVLPPPYLNPSPNVELVTVQIEMRPNGTFQKGGTGVNECSYVGDVYTCEPADPLEDCSTYGLDLGGYFQCIINNFGIWLRNTLIDLFVPNTARLSKTLDEFGESMQSQFGFIYTGFSMVVEWLNSILTINPICYIDTGDATFFGAEINFNFCGFEQSAPTIYNPLMTLARLSIAAGFVFIAWRRLKEITESLGTR